MIRKRSKMIQELYKDFMNGVRSAIPTYEDKEVGAYFRYVIENLDDDELERLYLETFTYRFPTGHA